MLKPEKKLFKHGQHVIDYYKLCAKCKDVKPVSEFNKFDKASTGYQSYCKECNAGVDRSMYEHKQQEKIVVEPNLFDEINNKQINDKPTKDMFSSGQHIISNLSGEWKLCPHCDNVLDTKEFDIGTENSTGLKSWCRKCMKTLPKERTIVDVINEIVIKQDEVNKLIKELHKWSITA